MKPNQRRQKRLLQWAANHPIVTQTGWSRYAQISLPTARKDFDAVAIKLEPVLMGRKTMGWTLRGAA